MSTNPKNIITGSFDKVVLASGVNIQSVSPFMFVGALVQIAVDGRDGGVDYVVETAGISTGYASPSIVIENVPYGRHPGDQLTEGDNITVAYLSPGVLFWGMVTTSQEVHVGTQLGSTGDGTLSIITGSPPPVTTLIGIATSAVTTTTEPAWLLVRAV